MKTNRTVQLYAKALIWNNIELIAEYRQKLRIEADELSKSIENYKVALNRDITESNKEKIRDRISSYQIELDRINELITKEGAQ